MQLLNSATRTYSWGSKTLIPHLQGKAASNYPIAELWYGAHPGGPATVEDEPLNAIIAADPQAALGENVAAEFDNKLPFLLKILSADEPLSLQAHPSKEQALQGFARENSQGVAMDAPQRSYKDDNHKPELIVALTDFYAMAGFRPLVHTRELFDALDCEELNRYAHMHIADGRLTQDEESDSLRALFTTWITIPATTRRELIAALMECSKQLLETLHSDSWMRPVLETLIDLDELYPGDVGVLGALLLNHVQLSPGEAIYLDAGQLHAYVRGLGVEIMANSDNVLRGGLTPKHVDVPELVKVLSFNTIADPRVEQISLSDSAQVMNYPVPVNEYALTRCDLKAGQEVTTESDGPAIILCTEGSLQLTAQDGTCLELSPSDAAWVPADDGDITLSTKDKAQAFIARV
ncbi:mannose-6-phosphate isomerase, class I [Corynebacterium ammoniagenes]|uniref:mannose-6-phosphate isomerase n=2 Tax=Corynebacterium ammoniagenes TaxID=1697 RepID=A0AAV5G9Q2_CORAM|nr:mannose-6-phosphate isomerase, class I [Corynebacterium ammoniagenes]APT83225.1 mannose-6-phosphate isomerase [Corynebacterium ammoniagenes DSM 20306]AQS74248.1 mannose-6-phosphate isomerase, class I [Corynebacterium ammoniagenes]EFG81538.1 mannose-6-phosphate isomerase, class I [Corynebacterium ammoniagenes DSM 20306]NMF32963.1 mannose-6-phosphate isomerase, class I [Corynebacterium ammoniagenes]GJN43522.1 mannose-6-phosphate isomerase, class I [Corynebacterium ammoniagenes]